MNVQTHTCGCATLGPGPHPVDARHPNARGCEHAEEARALLREPEFAALDGLREAAQEVADREPTVTDPEGLGGEWCLYCDRQTPKHEKWCSWVLLRAALQAEPARAEEGAS